MTCHVCKLGPLEGVDLHRLNRTGKAGIWACDAHRNRTKCEIDDCTRTMKHSGRRSDYLCAEHWRRFCPPRSRRRRAILGFYREAKRHGWSDDLVRRYYRVWDAMIRSARARARAGTPDIASINRIMGW